MIDRVVADIDFKSPELVDIDEIQRALHSFKEHFARHPSRIELPPNIINRLMMTMAPTAYLGELSRQLSVEIVVDKSLHNNQGKIAWEMIYSND